MKMEPSFILSRETEVYLYGAGTVGGILYRKLSESGFCVKGFIDKRADEISSFCNLPVYGITDRIENKKEAVVIIAVKNVFEHSRISRSLKAAGFRRVIYRPYSALEYDNNTTEHLLNTCYDIIVGSEVEQVDALRIPIIVENSKIGEKESGVIKEKESVVVYTPITMIFTDHKDNAPELSIMFLKPHINFIKIVLGLEGGEYETYLDYCEYAAKKSAEKVTITERWRNNVLRNRSEVIANMAHRFNTENTFFVRNAANALWNSEKRYFNLDSGKHRSVFLFTCGYNYIPLRISYRDYEEYVHFFDVETIRKSYSKEFDSGDCPITENPFFLSESWISEQFWFGILRDVMWIIRETTYTITQKNPFDGKSVFVSLNDGGVIPRYFERLGFKVNTIVNDDYYFVSIVCEETICSKIETEHSFVLSSKESYLDYKKISKWFHAGRLKYLYYVGKEF